MDRTLLQRMPWVFFFLLVWMTGRAEEPVVTVPNSVVHSVSYGSRPVQALPATESDIDRVERPVIPVISSVEKAEFIEGDPNIELSINLPAFRLTLWQNGREVKRYPIGIAQRKFEMPTGLRKAQEVVWNPPWIPPESDWVFECKQNVRPGEYIPAGDPRNPLGKIKIPIEKGFLLHQAGSSSDIGGLVSHGCIRVQLSDLQDLAHKIVSSRARKISPEQITKAEASMELLAVKLDSPLLVGITYDTIVIEEGLLRVYPDVYGHGVNTVDNLRAKLLNAGVDYSHLDDTTLAGILKRPKQSQAFVVALEDIQDGDALEVGRLESLKLDKVLLSRR